MNDSIKMIVGCVIAAVVLIGGIVTSSRRDPHEETITAEDADYDETEPIETTTPEAKAEFDEIVHIDLFSNISVYAAGIYPDIENIAITADPEDSVARKVTYSFSSVEDFTPTGAEAIIEVDTTEIDEYLTIRNFIPTSRTMTYEIDPLTMVSYLVQQRQFNSEVRKSCIKAAAEAVTGSEDAAPMQLTLLLPQKETVFDPVEKSYAGLYGLECFFAYDGGVRCGFACPSINPDGSVYMIDTAVSETYKDTSSAYAALVDSRLETESLLAIMLPVPVSEVNEND